MLNIYHDSDDEIENARAEGIRAGEARGYQKGYIAGQSAGISIGRAEGAAAERERIRSIMALDIARERPREAAHVALSTTVDARDAEGAIHSMVIGAQAAADASWAEINEKLMREAAGGRR